MPRGEHFKKYENREKLDAKITIRVNSELLKRFREIIINIQESIREFMREVAKSKEDRTIHKAISIDFETYGQLFNLTNNPSALANGIIKKYLKKGGNAFG